MRTDVGHVGLGGVERRYAMTRRLLMTTLMMTLLAGLTSVLVSAQARRRRHQRQEVRRARLPRTPWGHPDIAGVWSSDDMRGIPRERPDEFGTRRFLTDEEYAKRVRARRADRKQEGSRVGAFRNDVGTRTFRQTSLVIDPPDGKIPALTPEGQKRLAARTAGQLRRRPLPHH